MAPLGSFLQDAEVSVVPLHEVRAAWMVHERFWCGHFFYFVLQVMQIAYDSNIKPDREWRWVLNHCLAACVTLWMDDFLNLFFVKSKTNQKTTYFITDQQKINQISF